ARMLRLLVPKAAKSKTALFGIGSKPAIGWSVSAFSRVRLATCGAFDAGVLVAVGAGVLVAVGVGVLVGVLVGSGVAVLVGVGSDVPLPLTTVLAPIVTMLAWLWLRTVLLVM